MNRFFAMLPYIAVVCALFACFFGLGAYALLDNNEGMYASIARAMAEGSDLVIPHLNGVPYIEKPPLLYWLAAVSIRLFGPTEWASRLIPALSLLATIAVAGCFMARRAGRDTGSIAALILSSSIVIVAMGRTVYFDMLFTCFVTIGCCGIYAWLESYRPSFLRLAYVMAALAVMTKGILALVLMGGTGLVYLIVQRAPLRTYRRAFDPLGIALFLLIAVPWHVLAARVEPQFAWFYFINEHVLRFLNLRTPHDYYTGPVWYYLPRLLLYLFPWSLFLPLLARKDSVPPEGESRNLQRFLWCWFLCPLLFFSLSTAKANYYMLVGMPPMAMLLALKLAPLAKLEHSRLFSVIGTLIFALLAIPLLVLNGMCPHYIKLQPYCLADTPPMYLSMLLLAGAGIYALWRLPVRAGIAAIASTIFILLPLLIQGVNAGGQLLSQKEVAQYVMMHNTDQPLVMYYDFEEFSALAFYLGHPIQLVESDSADLLYGKQYHPEIAGSMQFYPWLDQVMRNGKPVRVLLNSHYIHNLQGYIDRSPYAKQVKLEITPFTWMSLVTLQPLGK